MDGARAAGGVSYTGTLPGGGSGLWVAAAVVSNRARVSGQETPAGPKTHQHNPGDGSGPRVAAAESRKLVEEHFLSVSDRLREEHVFSVNDSTPSFLSAVYLQNLQATIHRA